MCKGTQPPVFPGRSTAEHGESFRLSHTDTQPTSLGIRDRRARKNYRVALVRPHVHDDRTAQDGGSDEDADAGEELAVHLTIRLAR